MSLRTLTHIIGKRRKEGDNCLQVKKQTPNPIPNPHLARNIMAKVRQHKHRLSKRKGKQLRNERILTLLCERRDWNWMPGKFEIYDPRNAWKIALSIAGIC